MNGPLLVLIESDIAIKSEMHFQDKTDIRVKDWKSNNAAHFSS